MIDHVGNLEDGIQEMYCILKDGCCYNMEDFYAEHHAFDDGKTFYKENENLIADKKDVADANQS